MKDDKTCANSFLKIEHSTNCVLGFSQSEELVYRFSGISHLHKKSTDTLFPSTVEDMLHIECVSLLNQIFPHWNPPPPNSQSGNIFQPTGDVSIHWI